MRGKGFFLVILTLGLTVSPALAARPSKKAPASELKEIEKNLSAEQTKRASLRKEEEKLDRQVGDLRQKLVRSASKVQSLEQELNDLEAQLADLKDQEENLRKTLKKKRQHLGRMTASWLRLVRTPPELLLFSPMPPQQVIQAGSTFHYIVPRLYGEAEKTKAELLHLQELQEALKAKQQQVEAVRSSLSVSQDELSGLLAVREEKRLETANARESQEAKIQELVNRAQDLRDFMKKLDEEQAKKQAARKPRKPVKTGQEPNPNILPVAGLVQRGYGEKDEVSSESRGIAIAARPGATVTAPFSGTIQYAGTFRSYGKMVILTRDDGLHVLISGFDKIYGKAGDTTSRGEPLGLMPQRAKPVLYIEYRQGTEPIDPATVNLTDSARAKSGK